MSGRGKELPEALIDRGRLEGDVRALATPEGRLPGSEGHARAREYLNERMKELALEPYSGDDFHLPYRSGEFNGHNLAGTLPGADRGLAPVLVGAHYDSVIAAPCADDNAAAIAIVLAVAGEHSPGKHGQGAGEHSPDKHGQGGYGAGEHSPDKHGQSGHVPGAHAPVEHSTGEHMPGRLQRDLVIAFFDAEEHPHTHTERMGSVRFYEDLRDRRGFHCAIIQDLTGHEVSLPLGDTAHHAGAGRLANLLFVTGAESDAMLPPAIEACVDPGRLPLVATPNRNVGDVSDHAVFRRNGVPYLFLSCGQWAHYHKPSDTPDRLSYEKMGRIAELICCLLRPIDRSERGSFGGNAARATVESEGERSGGGNESGGAAGGEMVDTVGLESRLLQLAFGPALGRVLALAGLSQANSRDELDRFAARLKEAGLRPGR